MGRKSDAYMALGQLAELRTPEATAALRRLAELAAAVLAAEYPDQASALLADYQAKLLLLQALPGWQWGESWQA